MSLLRSGVLVAATLALSLNLLSQQTLTSAEQPQAASPAQSQNRVASPANDLTQAQSEEKTAKTETSQDQNKDSTDSKQRKTHIGLGAVTVGAGYSHFSGSPYPYGYGPYGYYPYDGLYSGMLWSPIWGPYYDPAYFSRGYGRGEVRLSADPKTAAVYVDGGYAGTADKLKNIWLDPGAYDLSVTADGREPFKERIYVLSGKSVKIAAKLSESKDKPQP